MGDRREGAAHPDRPPDRPPDRRLGRAPLRPGAAAGGLAGSPLAPAWLQLLRGGDAEASDGCNRLTGRWALEEGVLRLSDVVTTDSACPDLERQTEHVAAVPLAGPRVEHDGASPRLTAGDRGLDDRAGA